MLASFMPVLALSLFQLNIRNFAMWRKAELNIAIKAMLREGQPQHFIKTTTSITDRWFKTCSQYHSGIKYDHDCWYGPCNPGFHNSFPL